MIKNKKISESITLENLINKTFREEDIDIEIIKRTSTEEQLKKSKNED
jgi:hypothetical protein